LSPIHDHARFRYVYLGKFVWTSGEPDAEPLPDTTEHSQETAMPPAEFEPAIPARDWQQIHALDGVSTGIGA
jgi:hypothetical protein